MLSFFEWLVFETRTLVDPGVVASYERAFQAGLEGLIQRTRDPELRRAFEGMRGFRFTNYIVGALVRHGVHQQYDPDDCLQRIVFRMLSPVGERGLPHKGLFAMDENLPYNLKIGNPLEARFRTFLANDLRSIMMGRIPALRRTQRPGSITIAYGKQGSISPDEIPGRPADHEQEMMTDIAELLRQRSTPDLDLVALFRSILAGQGTRSQRTKFGHNKADQGRKVIVQTIEDYARQTQNWHLLRLLDRFRDFDGTRPDSVRQPAKPPKPPKPVRPGATPDEQDYRSIVQVLENNGRSVSMLILGKVRRRWLERPPRNPNSQYPNRLADVLARMVADGVLTKVGARYVPDRNYEKYLAPQGAVSVS